MTSSGENCLILQQSPNVNWQGAMGHAPLEISKFRSSEIAGNSYFLSIFMESLTIN